MSWHCGLFTRNSLCIQSGHFTDANWKNRKRHTRGSCQSDSFSNIFTHPNFRKWTIYGIVQYLFSRKCKSCAKCSATFLSCSDTSLNKIHTSFTLCKNSRSKYEVRVSTKVCGAFHESIPTDIGSLLILIFYVFPNL